MGNSRKQSRKHSLHSHVASGNLNGIKQSKREKNDETGKPGIIQYSTLSLFGVIIVCVACSLFMMNIGPYFVSVSTIVSMIPGDKMKAGRDNLENNIQSKALNVPVKKSSNTNLNKNFKLQILNRLEIKSGPISGASFKVRKLKSKNKETTVQAFVLDDFLSAYECDALAAAHDSHVVQTSKLSPLLCFDSLKTFKQNLKEVNIKLRVSDKDFIEGTTCINESLSLLLGEQGFKWSYSTSFYPGESKFSLTLQERIKQATGLIPENGGKFQITSYAANVGYKNHTDCVVGGDKRDRYATILVYLKDVAKGGETVFPQLGLSVKPKKGLALVWNSMSEDGHCDPTSIHNAAKVIKGHKYILQRWYYYHNFPSLGKRMQEPNLPQRKSNQPRVSCDEYEHGSCRWYDEWNYDHIIEYVRNQYMYL